MPPNPVKTDTVCISKNEDCRIVMNVYYNPVASLRRLIEDNKSLYVPVIGGAASNEYCTDDWCRNNLFRDDDGEDNISRLNNRYNELTSIYWYWKNKLEKDSPKYVGYNHYRRFFKLEDIEDYWKYDIIAQSPIPMLFTTNGNPTPISCDIEFGYLLCHSIKDFYMMMEELSGLGYGEIAYRWKQLDSLVFPCNMFLMKRELFEEYCNFVFPILDSLNRRIDTNGRDNYQKRAIAFISERLFSFWAFMKICRNSLSYKVVNVDFNKEWKDNELNERGTY